MFSINLKLSLANSDRFQVNKQKDNSTNTEYWLHQVYEVFQDSQLVVFSVTGFGQSPWPVDMADLLAIVEQLPEWLNWVHSQTKAEFNLDFYEQGLERSLIFTRTLATVRIICNSRRAWLPNPEEEYIDNTQLIQMLDEFVNKFVYSVRFLCPNVVVSKEFMEWCQQGSIAKHINPTIST